MIDTGGRRAAPLPPHCSSKDFTGGLPWVHLDIAGTAWAEENRPFMPKGPTGVGVRTLVEVARRMRDWN